MSSFCSLLLTYTGHIKVADFGLSRMGPVKFTAVMNEEQLSKIIEEFTDGLVRFCTLHLIGLICRGLYISDYFSSSTLFNLLPDCRYSEVHSARDDPGNVLWEARGLVGSGNYSLPVPRWLLSISRNQVQRHLTSGGHK